MKTIKLIIAMLLTLSLVSFNSGPMFRTQNKVVINTNLLLDPTSFTFISGSASISVTVTCNTTWNVSNIVCSAGGTFISCNPTSGTGNGSFTISVTENTGYPRFGTVTVTAGGVNAYVDIEQDGELLI